MSKFTTKGFVKSTYFILCSSISLSEVPLYIMPMGITSFCLQNNILKFLTLKGFVIFVEKVPILI